MGVVAVRSARSTLARNEEGPSAIRKVGPLNRILLSLRLIQCLHLVDNFTRYRSLPSQHLHDLRPLHFPDPSHTLDGLKEIEQFRVILYNQLCPQVYRVFADAPSNVHHLITLQELLSD